jgi:hypothetical protein
MHLYQPISLLVGETEMRIIGYWEHSMMHLDDQIPNIGFLANVQFWFRNISMEVSSQHLNH